MRTIFCNRCDKMYEITVTDPVIGLHDYTCDACKEAARPKGNVRTDLPNLHMPEEFWGPCEIKYILKVEKIDIFPVEKWAKIIKNIFNQCDKILGKNKMSLDTIQGSWDLSQTSFGESPMTLEAVWYEKTIYTLMNKHKEWAKEVKCCMYGDIQYTGGLYNIV